MKAWLSVAAALVALALSACAPARADNDADRMGRTTIDAIQRNDWIVIDKNLAPVMAEDPQHAPKIVVLQSHFPADPPWSIKLISSGVTKEVKGKSPERETLSYLYTFPDRRLLVDLVVEHVGWRRYPEPKPLKPGQLAPEPPANVVEPPIETTEPAEPKPVEGWKPYRVVRIYKLDSVAVRPVAAADEAAAKFWAPGKSLAQWAFLMATLLMPAVMLSVAIAVARAKALPWKLAWFALCFVGVGAAWMNWTSGVAGLEPAINLVGFGLSRGPSPLSPWILGFALPVGALISALRLALRRRP